VPVDRSFFEEVGGHETFRQLIHTFYAGIPDDPVLAPLYPEDDLEPAEERLRMFLEQYWGGPRTYSEQRGHPRLRQRHALFRITPRARAAWLSRMQAALADLALPARLEQTLWEYLVAAADSLVNAFESEPVESGLPLLSDPPQSNTATVEPPL